MSRRIPLNRANPASWELMLSLDCSQTALEPLHTAYDENTHTIKLTKTSGTLLLSTSGTLLGICFLQTGTSGTLVRNVFFVCRCHWKSYPFGTGS
ncbi:hypothetical protein CEXT_579611 [Caerostris extrusa]|uniref:Uncharacterized protein n=1 Tax=Caerostris extrusa TaxID=172846 RepID=A0AAV4V0R1_CAEEX|nr:hypothetical protein CEXT_579611 [Caerostris extrusa]